MGSLDLGDIAHRVESAVEQVLAQHPSIPSAAVALCRSDGQRAEVIRGAADPATGEPLTASHSYRIASCTKSFVAATVVSLADEGRLDLDAPVSGMLDAAIGELFARYEHAREVTVRQLLQHRSGLVDHSTFPEFTVSVTTEWTPAGQLEIAVRRPALFAPGAACSYSDSGYVLLGQMIEHLTGRPLAQAVRARAGVDADSMPSLHWEVVEPTPPGIPRAHQWLEGLDTFDWNPSFDLFGGGGLVSSLPDLCRWWSNWFTGRHGRIAVHLADPAPTLGPDGVAFPGGDRMGLGLYARRVDDVAVWSHGGFWGLEAGFVPDAGVAYAVSLTHRAPGLPSPQVLGNAVVAALLAAG